MAHDDIKYHAPSREFADADLQTLGDACNALSFELRLINQPARAPEERAALVECAAGLLFHASRAITPQSRTAIDQQRQALYDRSVADAAA